VTTTCNASAKPADQGEHLLVLGGQLNTAVQAFRV
jgi:hypothetical protein